MKPGRIANATRALGEPAGWDRDKQGECDVLEIRDREGLMESAWYPSEDEKAAIAEGRPIILTVWGKSHPPVSINVSEHDEIDVTRVDDKNRRLLNLNTGKIRDGGPIT